MRIQNIIVSVAALFMAVGFPAASQAQSGGVIARKVLTSPSTPYTPTSGTSSIDVQCVGGGGGGGGAQATGSGQSSGGTGGTGGSGFLKHLASGFASGQNIVVGQGGTGGAGANDGGTGGTSYFGTSGSQISTAPGGHGGHYGPAAPFTAIWGSAPQPATNGDLNIQGGQAPCLENASPTVASSGSGGDSPFGLGFGGNAQATTGATNGVVGTGYGSGGSGAAATQSHAAQSGANGQPGVCIVTEYQ